MNLAKSKLSANVKTVAQVRPDRRKADPSTFKTHREDKLDKTYKEDESVVKKHVDKIRASIDNSIDYLSKSRSKTVLKTTKKELSEMSKGKKDLPNRRKSGW